MKPFCLRSFPQMGAFFKPNHLMADFISRELARGNLKVRIYTPYIVAAVSMAPWPVPSAEHTAAAVNWKANRQEAKAVKAVNRQPSPFNSWMMYRVRFIFTSDLFGAWAEFGGLSAHLNFLPILLRIVTTESISSALLYGGLITTHMEELSRSRANRTAGLADFPNCCLTRILVSSCMRCGVSIETDPNNSGRAEKEKSDKEAKRAWPPKKEYMGS